MAIRVLIAEDEEITRKHIRNILQGRGLRRHGHRERKAYELLGKDRFDVLIADIKMPGITGLELLEKAKEESPETDVGRWRDCLFAE